MPSSGLLLSVAGLALLDMLSPAVIATTLYVLLSGARSTARPLLAYLATVAAFYFALGCALVLGLGLVLEPLSGLVSSRPAGWAMAALGALMLIWALFAPTRAAPRRTPPTLRTPAMIALGLATGVLEAGTALPYFGAIALMTTAQLPAAAWLPILAAYNLAMVLPAIVLHLLHRTLGQRLRPRLEHWRAKAESGSREAAAWIVGIAGFLLLRHGLSTADLSEITINLSGGL